MRCILPTWKDIWDTNNFVHHTKDKIYYNLAHLIPHFTTRAPTASTKHKVTVVAENSCNAIHPCCSKAPAIGFPTSKPAAVGTMGIIIRTPYA